MASLTPGVLTKLLDNVGNKDAKVKGEHRTALLQVLEIIPSLGGDDPWQSKGFFLKVSDSMHSGYVSICQDDLDLIYTDKIKLGQFVYVGWLDSGSPVPVLRGLKPVSRRRPCVGNPKDLMSSDLLQIKGNVGFAKESRGVRKDVILKGMDRNKRRELLGKGDVKLQSFEPRRLSLDSARRSWDQNALTPRNAPARVKSKNVSSSSDFSPIQYGRKFSSKDDTSLKISAVAISPLKNKNGTASPRLASRSLEPVPNLSSKAATTVPESLENLRKVPLRFKKWCDQGISWDALPSSIHNLGKGAVQQRNTAFLAAVQALEEASVSDAVIHCMSAFAELCKSSQKVSVQSLLQQFLDLHQKMRVAAGAVKTLIDSRTTQPKPEINFCQKSQSSASDVCKAVKSRNAVSWILAAMESDLSKFSLYRPEEEKEIKKNINQHYVIIENTSNGSDNHSIQEKKITSKHKSETSYLPAKRVASPFKLNSPVMHKSTEKEWSVGSGLKDAACLSEKLLKMSCEWFLKYLDDSLKHGFGLKQKDRGGRELADLLGQLKRVDQWLDTLVEDEAEVEGRINELKKKLYKFLLEHVNSAFAAG